jgi:hypothetical protein
VWLAGGAPDWSLTLWQWEKARAVNSIRVSNSQGAAVHHCSFCPNDPNFVCVTGNGILRFFRVDLQVRLFCISNSIFAC